MGVAGPAAGALELYVVECFVPGSEHGALVAAVERVRVAAVGARRAGSAIEYVGTLLMPADEVVFHLFRSANADAVRETCTAAQLAFDRVIASEYLAAVS